MSGPGDSSFTAGAIKSITTAVIISPTIAPTMSIIRFITSLLKIKKSWCHAERIVISNLSNFSLITCAKMIKKVNIYMNNYTHLSKLLSILNDFVFL